MKPSEYFKPVLKLKYNESYEFASKCFSNHEKAFLEIKKDCGDIELVIID